MKKTKRSAPRGKRATADAGAGAPGGGGEVNAPALFPVVGIGASAGGLEAFSQLLAALPADLGMAYVLVQHLDPEHESALVQLLAKVTSLPVREITEDEPVKANHVHVIPRDTQLTIAGGALKLQPRERTRRPHRPIDAFFESLAEDRREGAIGVVLSGTASDGTLGLEAIKAEGGITFAQDESARHESMPRSAVAAGCVDFVLSPAEIAGELARIARHPYLTPAAQDDVRPPGESAAEDRAAATAHAQDSTPLPSGGSGRPRSGARRVREEAARAPENGPARERAAPAAKGRTEDGYKKVLLLLRNHSGVDFSLYKSSTIQRRINRRIIVNKRASPADYATFLRDNPEELEALYSDVLVSVTSFFRNPEVFEVLQREALPRLLRQPGDEPVRCWVLGCSTGQEAYSIAMAFVEAMDRAPRLRRLQVFATDLNEALLDKARQGLYAKSLADDVSPERLRRFFVEEPAGYRVTKALREMVVFARQNLIADPPFSRLDLISCRNLLIYLEPSLQVKALPTFHYALKPGGFLMLGASESIGSFTELFEPVDRRYRIYAKKPVQTPASHLPIQKSVTEPPPSGRRRGRGGRTEPEPAMGPSGEINALREADRITVGQFAPPGVVVDSELQVLQFRGPTGAYLEPPAGKASFDLLRMARPGLRPALRAALDQAGKENKPARRENVRVLSNGAAHAVHVQVVPLKNLNERWFLVFFEDARGARERRERPKPRASKELEPSRIEELEAELTEARDQLQSVQERHAAATEELQASNEEAQSANEELQSVNEELETSKEELESTNEELTTLNDELASRNAELNRLNGDLLNLQTSGRLAIVLLGRDLAIRHFSPQAAKQLNLLSTDVGRPIGHIRHGLVDMATAALPAAERPGDEAPAGPLLDPPGRPLDLERLGAEVIAEVREREHEVLDGDGRWHFLRARPYMTLDDRVDGAVLVLVDIDAVKRSELAAARALASAETTIETMPTALLMMDADLRVERANSFFYRAFRVAPAETIGTFIYDLGNRQWDIPRLRELLEEILPSNRTVTDFEVDHHFEQLGRRTMVLNAVRHLDPVQQADRILLSILDITERKRAEEALERAHAELQANAEELTRFNRAAVGRESRMIELKKEVNELCRRLGEPAAYPLDFEAES